MLDSEARADGRKHDGLRHKVGTVPGVFLAALLSIGSECAGCEIRMVSEKGPGVPLQSRSLLLRGASKFLPQVFGHPASWLPRCVSSMQTFVSGSL